jgi:hypothetical protein
MTTQPAPQNFEPGHERDGVNRLQQTTTTALKVLAIANFYAAAFTFLFGTQNLQTGAMQQPQAHCLFLVAVDLSCIVLLRCICCYTFATFAISALLTVAIWSEGDVFDQTDDVQYLFFSAIFRAFSYMLSAVFAWRL